MLGVALIAGLLGGQDVADGYNLHRLFSIGETARYECAIETARNVVSPGQTLVSEKRTIKATVRLKTVTVREGVATQLLTIAEAAAAEPDPKKTWELDAFRLGEMRQQVQRSGAASWEYSRKGKPVNMSWLTIPLSPTEWAPPLPDKLVNVGDTYAGPLSFPLRAFYPEPGWPVTVDVPTTFTFLGREGKDFYISRSGELTLDVKSSDGKGKLSGKMTALGSYYVDGTGRLARSDLTWVAKLSARAPGALGGLRSVEYVVSVKCKLVDVGAADGK
jgi:hypothetical protein